MEAAALVRCVIIVGIVSVMTALQCWA